MRFFSEEDFRIGNWVDTINRRTEIHLPVNYPRRIIEIRIGQIMLENANLPKGYQLVSIRDISPLKVSHEVLIDSGFVNERDFYRQGVVEIGLAKRLGDLPQNSSPEDFFLSTEEMYAISAKPLIWVHELQNAYMALEGKSLNYTPPPKRSLSLEEL